MDTTLSGLQLPTLEGPLPAEEIESADALVDLFEQLAEKALSDGILTLPYHLEGTEAEPLIARVIELISDGIDPEELVDNITGKLATGEFSPAEEHRIILGLYGGLIIARGFQGLVMRIYLKRLIAGIGPGEEI